MRILLDENIPHKLNQLFSQEIEVKTVGQCGWKGMRNGELIQLAQKEFDAFITIDKGIPHQQNLSGFKLIIILLDSQSNRYADLVPLIEKANITLQKAQPGEIISITG